ncbi:MAG: hypothetical protein QXV77_04380 [Candidatus Bathyarchaeia archaeon]
MDGIDLMLIDELTLTVVPYLSRVEAVKADFSEFEGPLFQLYSGYL